MNSNKNTREKHNQQIGSNLRCQILKIFNQKVTAYILFICSFFIVHYQIHNPISCTATGDLIEQESVVNSICWASRLNSSMFLGTLTIMETRDLTENDKQRMKRTLEEYGRIYLILAFQGILFVITARIWSVFLNVLDQYIKRIEEAAYYFKPSKDKSENQLLIETDSYIYLNISSISPSPFWGKNGSKFALKLFSFSKIFFLLVSFAQLYFLDGFIGDGSQLFGVEVVSRMWNDEYWFIFPRHAICKFSFSGEESDKQSVYCYLTMNSSNEAIFTFMWFWLFLIIIIHLIDLISWIISFMIINKRDTYKYVRKRLNMDFMQLKNEILLRQFVEDYLREDFVFMLRLLSLRKSQDRIVSEFLPNLFEFYMTKQNKFVIDREWI